MGDYLNRNNRHSTFTLTIHMDGTGQATVLGLGGGADIRSLVRELRPNAYPAERAVVLSHRRNNVTYSPWIDCED